MIHYFKKVLKNSVDMSVISDLQKQSEQIFSQISRHQSSYFHRKSMDNFIYHLSNITDVGQREKTEKTIISYLTEINEAITNQDFDINMEMSEYFFKKYLKDLIYIYDSQIGFVPVFGKKAYIIIVPCIFIVFYLLRQNEMLLLVVSTLLFLYLVRILIKAVKRKLYGFGY